MKIVINCDDSATELVLGRIAEILTTDLVQQLACIDGKLDQHAHILKLLKEIKHTMATQADVDAVTQQLEDIKTAVAAQGVEIAKIGSDLVAFIAANPNVSISALQAKASEVGNAIAAAGAALQAVDDLVPEQTPPTP